MPRIDILPGDRSQKAKNFRKKERGKILTKIGNLQDKIGDLREQYDNLPCDLCGQGSCSFDCW